MSRWIDANALAHKVAINGDADFINKVTKLMIDAPSIDIVRCKECKNKGTEDCPMKEWNYTWAEYEFFNDADDFCSYGERSE